MPLFFNAEMVAKVRGVSPASAVIFLLPNNVFALGLSPGEFAVYSFLQRCADRKTRQCYPSHKTIGAEVGMSENTVHKYICALADKVLISTENTKVFTKDGMKRNGTLLYTICDPRSVMDARYRQLFNQLETTAAKQATSKPAPV